MSWSLIGSARINRRFPPSGRMTDLPGGPVHAFSGASAASGAQALLLVHGAASNGRELPAALGARLDRFDWLAPDRPGLGHTPRRPAAHELAVQAATMAEVIERQLAGRPVIAVGHSWGSAVVLRLAVDRPDLVEGLVLLAPASHPWGGQTSLTNRLAVLPVVGPVLCWLLPPLLGPMLAPSGIARGFAPGPVQPPDYGERIGTALYFRPHSFAANAADMVAADRELAAQAARYPTISIPVSVISGQGDMIVSNTIHAKSLTIDLPHAATHKVAGAGHMPHWVDPDLVIAEIDRQMDENSARKRPGAA
ncbi:MAG: alpha/beta hydrolase [Hyphomonadaceae bacterium]|nr:alpha/beta hydrolase [Hyphomonadaceae bacterium]